MSITTDRHDFNLYAYKAAGVTTAVGIALTTTAVIATVYDTINSIQEMNGDIQVYQSLRDDFYVGRFRWNMFGDSLAIFAKGLVALAGTKITCSLFRRAIQLKTAIDDTNRAIARMHDEA